MKGEGAINDHRRCWLRRFAAFGPLGVTNATVLVRYVLAAGNRPIVPGMQKLTGKVVSAFGWEGEETESVESNYWHSLCPNLAANSS